MSGVNTLYNALAHAPGIEEVDFSQLVFAVSGGMATQAAVAKKWKQVTGQPIVEGYGLSETSPVVCANRLDIEEFTGTIGYPLPSTDVVRARCRRRGPASRRARRTLREGSAGHGGLLAAARRDREGHDGGRLFPHRRRGGHPARRAGEDRRPDEGHDPRLRLQRLSQRGRGRDRQASRRHGSGGHRSCRTSSRARPSSPMWCARTRPSRPTSCASSAGRT